MSELKELIRHYPELGDLFAEWENRISFLENSIPYQKEEQPKPELKEEPWSNKQRDTVNQIRLQCQYLRGKLMEHLAPKDAKQKKGKKYTDYLIE